MHDRLTHMYTVPALLWVPDMMELASLSAGATPSDAPLDSTVVTPFPCAVDRKLHPVAENATMRLYRPLLRSVRSRASIAFILKLRIGTACSLPSASTWVMARRCEGGRAASATWQPLGLWLGEP